MPALTFINNNSCKCSLSFTYAGLTLYTHHVQGIEKFKQCVMCIRDTYDDLIVRCVENDHDDHQLFHQDNFKRHPHWHLKFKAPLKRDQLVQILEIIIQRELFTNADKEKFLRKFDLRYLRSRKNFAAILTENIRVDFVNIMQFISNIKDNDILIDLHEYLLTEKFDYLREKIEENNSSNKFWQGIDRDGFVVRTTEYWAKIEAAIALKMAANIKQQCTKFTEFLAQERAVELKQNHSFFALKRRGLTTTPEEDITNSLYTIFAMAETNKLNAKFEKVFK